MDSEACGEVLCGLPVFTQDGKAIHQVYVHGIWMDKSELPNAEFERCVGGTGYVAVVERTPTKMQFPMASDETINTTFLSLRAINSSRSANLSSRLRCNYFLAFVALCFLSAQDGAYATGARTLSPHPVAVRVLSRALNSHKTNEPSKT